MLQFGHFSLFPCSPGEFQCNNTHCIYPAQICDLKDDCGDGSDEDFFCRSYDCLKNQFKVEAYFYSSTLNINMNFLKVKIIRLKL